MRLSHPKVQKLIGEYKAAGNHVLSTGMSLASYCETGLRDDKIIMPESLRAELEEMQDELGVPFDRDQPLAPWGPPIEA